MSIGFRSVRWFAAAMFAAALVAVSAGAASAQAAKPAGASLERAMKYAPDDAAGLIHVDVKALVKDVLAGIVKGMEPNAIPPELIQAIGKVGEKVEAVDVFLLSMGGEGPPMPLVVVHGTIAAEELTEAMKNLPYLRLALKKGENGRYSFENKEAPISVLFGGEAPGLPAGVIVGGLTPMLTKEFLAGLGKGKNEELAKLLKDVDTTAPVWMAVMMSKIAPDPDAPKTIAGALYLLGGGKTRIAFDFPEAKAAADFEKEMRNAKGIGKAILPAFDVTQDKTLVALTAKTNDSLVPTVAAALAEARRLARTASSKANLRSIGMAIALYMGSTTSDRAPEDFLALIADDQSPGMFISPHSGKPVPKVEKGKVVGPFEPDYVYLKYPKLSSADAGLIVAYEKPEFYKNEGTNVLFVGLHVGWLDMKEFQALLKKSQEAIAAQEKAAKEK
jgi:hypothetical protein